MPTVLLRCDHGSGTAHFPRFGGVPLAAFLQRVVRLAHRLRCEEAQDRSLWIYAGVEPSNQLANDRPLSIDVFKGSAREAPMLIQEFFHGLTFCRRRIVEFFVGILFVFIGVCMEIVDFFESEE